MVNRTIPPKIQPVGDINFISPQKAILDNEIILHAFPTASQEIINIELVFNCGTWDSLENPLIAKHAPKMLPEGTANKNAREIHEFFDYYGAYIETSTGMHYTTISVAVLVKNLPHILPLLEEIIKSPAFPEKEFNTQIHSSKNKFLIQSQENAFVARKKFYRTVFGNTHPYGRELTENDYLDLSVNQLVEYYNTHLSANNCTIFISGGFDFHKTYNLINKHFGGHWKNTSKPIHYYEISPEDKYLYINKKNALQSAIKIGTPTIKKQHPDYPKLQVANMLLGGFFGSRLMKNIREDKGYTYGIGSGVLSYLRSGLFIISTEVGTEYTQPAIDEIYKEIKLLQTELVNNDELNLVKNYMLGQLLKKFDGIFEINHQYKNAILFNLDYPSFYQNYIEEIKKTSPEDIRYMAQKYFDTAGLFQVIVGKIK